MHTLQEGSTLQQGKYVVKRVLGGGGFGITYEGVQQGLNRRVAIKEFFMNDYCEREDSTSHVTVVGTKGTKDMVKQFREKFIKEAQLIASMESAPHVIRIYDIFEENETAYYVMQFIEGGSLLHLVKEQGALSEERTLGIMSQTMQALGYLHARQTMHLDVKPANILLRKNNDLLDDVVLIDFGVSKHYDQSGHQTTNTPVGFSKGYAPLEQYRESGVGQFSPTADVYSVGATMYTLLTGKNPPEAAALLSEKLNRPQNISDRMWQVISRAMSVRPQDRYQSMEEMLEAMTGQKAISEETEATVIVDKRPETTEARLARTPNPSEETVVMEHQFAPQPIHRAANNPVPQVPPAFPNQNNAPHQPQAQNYHNTPNANSSNDNNSTKKYMIIAATVLACLVVLGIIVLGGGYMLLNNKSSDVTKTETFVAEQDDSGIKTNGKSLSKNRIDSNNSIWLSVYGNIGGSAELCMEGTSGWYHMENEGYNSPRRRLMLVSFDPYTGQCILDAYLNNNYVGRLDGNIVCSQNGDIKEIKRYTGIFESAKGSRIDFSFYAD